MQSSELITPLAIQTPFAINGDKNIPAQNATGTDTSSINLGFLPITSEPLDEGGIAPERTDFNGMFYLATDQRVFLQNGGLITYNTDVATSIGGYPQGAILTYIDNNGTFSYVESLVDNNQYNFVTTPSYINGVYWRRVILYNTANLTLSNISSTSSPNFDGQWTYKMNGGTLSATSAGTYMLDLSTYLGVSSSSTIQYEVIFNHVYYSGSSSTRNGIVYSDVISATTFEDPSGTTGTMRATDQGRTTGYIGTIPVKTKLYVRLLEGFALNHLHVIGYRRLGTNT